MNFTLTKMFTSIQNLYLILIKIFSAKLQRNKGVGKDDTEKVLCGVNHTTLDDFCNNMTSHIITHFTKQKDIQNELFHRL